MNFSLIFKKFYPHPIEKVWAVVTNASALSQWLMPTESELKLGQKFFLWEDFSSREIGRVECELIEMAAPHRMVWSWKSQGQEKPSHLVFELESTEGGSNLTLKHASESGGVPSELGENKWPGKLTNLDSWLDTSF